jgi:Putative DNA-binding domain
MRAIFLGGDQTLPEQVSEAPPQVLQTLWPYLSSRRANAQRALRITYPTVATLLGGDAFDELSLRFFSVSPHVHADWGAWGEGFAACLDKQPELEHLPYLPDVARLDWLCHVSERAQDTAVDVASLAWVGAHSPDALRLCLAHDLGVLTSSHPVLAIWHAHHGEATQRPRWQAMANEPFPLGQRRHVLVHRTPWRAVPVDLPEPALRFVLAVMAGQSLAQALDAVEPEGFDLVQWLPRAIQQGWVVGLAEHLVDPTL